MDDRDLIRELAARVVFKSPAVGMTRPWATAMADFAALELRTLAGYEPRLTEIACAVRSRHAR